MIKFKKLSLFILIFFISSFSFAENQDKSSIELIGVEEGKTYSSPIKLKFIVKNMKVLAAGINEKNSGHHHLLLNLKDLPDLKKPLPMTDKIIHFGKAQTSTLLELGPGKHTIQLLFADYSHTPHKIPLITKKITFYIE